MKFKFSSFLFGLCALFASQQSATAAITYVDATSGPAGNTTLADGSVFSPPLNGNTGADNNWEQRTTFGTGGSIYEAGGEVAAENAPELRTRISGLVAGEQYRVFAYFYDVTGNTVENWNIRAGFTSNPGANTLFTQEAGAIGTSTASVLASTQTFVVNPALADPASVSRNLLAADLGLIFANGLGEIDVFIDDLGATRPSVNQRTWYDGVGYEVSAIPEPSSMALLGVVATGYFVRRRKMRAAK